MLNNNIIFIRLSDLVVYTLVVEFTTIFALNAAK